MNFIGIGPLELIVVLLVALVVVGPERLPKLAADLARTIRELRKYTGQFAAEFTDVVKEFEKETEAERGQWKEIGEGLNSASKSVADAAKPITEAVEGARADAAAPSQGKSAAAPAPTSVPNVASGAAVSPPAPPNGANGAAPPAPSDKGAAATNGATTAPAAPAPEPEPETTVR